VQSELTTCVIGIHERVVDSFDSTSASLYACKCFTPPEGTCLEQQKEKRREQKNNPEILVTHLRYVLLSHMCMEIAYKETVSSKQRT